MKTSFPTWCLINFKMLLNPGEIFIFEDDHEAEAIIDHAGLGGIKAATKGFGIGIYERHPTHWIVGLNATDPDDSGFLAGCYPKREMTLSDIQDILQNWAKESEGTLYQFKPQDLN